MLRLCRRGNAKQIKQGVPFHGESSHHEKADELIPNPIHLHPGADVDVLLPSLHWLYETSHHPGRIPGILVDGGANVGRASARWVAAFGDSSTA